MVRPQHFLLNHKRFIIVFQCLGIITKVSIHIGYVFISLRCIRMLFSKLFLSDRKCFFIVFQCLRVISLNLILFGRNRIMIYLCLIKLPLFFLAYNSSVVFLKPHIFLPDVFFRRLFPVLYYVFCLL